MNTPNSPGISSPTAALPVEVAAAAEPVLDDVELPPGIVLLLPAVADDVPELADVVVLAVFDPDVGVK